MEYNNEAVLPPIEWNCGERKPRPQQEEMLDFIRGSKARHVMIDAPTGVGKSPVNVSVANSQGGIILTPYKALQDQYTRDWPEIPVVKGAANYKCDEARLRTGGVYDDCGMLGSCSRRSPKSENPCPYAEACREVMIHSPIGIANYAWLLATIGHREWKGTHRWLVMDEGHQLEQCLANTAEVTVTAKECESVGVEFYLPDSLDDSETLLDRFYAAASSRVQLLMQKYKDAPKELSKEDLKQLRTLEPKVSLIGHVLWDCFDSEGGDRELSEWVMDVTDDKDDGSKVSWKPLYAKGIFQRLIEPLGTRILLTSATLLDPESMADWFGWQDDYDLLRMDSPFADEQRQIRYIGCGTAPLNAKNIEDQMPLVVKEMDRILSKPYASQRKGIIHAHSFKIASMIEACSRHRGRFIMHRRGMDQSAVLAEHAASDKPTIIVSPSMTEGVDLHGSLGRFAIFPKVPYPYLGDPWVARRKEVDGRWFNSQVAQTFVQGSGRIVRSRDDVGVTYILDGGFRQFYNRSAMLFPEWWRDSIRWQGGL